MSNNSAYSSLNLRGQRTATVHWTRVNERPGLTCKRREYNACRLRKGVGARHQARQKAVRTEPGFSGRAKTSDMLENGFGRPSAKPNPSTENSAATIKGLSRNDSGLFYSEDRFREEPLVLLVFETLFLCGSINCLWVKPSNSSFLRDSAAIVDLDLVRSDYQSSEDYLGYQDRPRDDWNQDIGQTDREHPFRHSYS